MCSHLVFLLFMSEVLRESTYSIVRVGTHATHHQIYIVRVYHLLVSTVLTQNYAPFDCPSLLQKFVVKVYLSPI